MEASSCVLDDAAEDMKLTMYLKEKQKHSSVDGAPNPASARHALPPSSAVATPSCTAEGRLEQIKVGSFYEIDHSKLSSSTPEQLRAIRIVMVSDKDEINVSLRYPSVYSLRTHFRNFENPNGKELPGLNEKYIMSSNVAGDVLYRRIPATEIAERRNSWSFWTAPSENADRDQSSTSGGEVNNAASKKGICWSELKFTGMVQWGSRRQVQYIGRHEDKKIIALSKSFEQEEAKNDSLGEGEKKTDQENGEEIFKVEDSDGKGNSLKRKRYCSRNIQKNLKKSTPEKKNGLKLRNTGKKKELKKSIDRWSVERYKLAEENMLKIMRAKGAVFGNPILRPALRAEARKLIGDTGLLDHLLKHMAGKVAPGGVDRFRRRHNADGAMEYWLESADLINIRKEVGVQDPYWTPPPGWKLGDNPTQDPICSREIKELHEEIAEIKKYILELASAKQQDINIETQPNSDVVPTSLDHEEHSLTALKEIYNELLKRKAKIEEQLIQISESLHGMEQEERRRRKQVQEGVEEEGNMVGYMVAKTEDKAAKIRRLKSGFRICKPQGTFLWPNMAMSPHSVMQQVQDDPVVVPTPPSASSTTAAPRLSLSPSPSTGPHPTSPVKPLARRPVGTTTTTTISNLTRRPNLINLNEVPPHTQLCDLALCGTLTYQRRNPNAPACHDLPNLVCGKHENDGVEGVECSGSVSSSTPSWLLMRDKWLLDLATSKSSLDPFSESE
ncbi:protein DYAD-like [Cucurbita moschata]|uniref:Protein DYAD-like n=1 Tax=Cucurbita moschata TaxID=3662 RepID=A0A6J1EMH8_CUCMO|nr:protein DYAD-like [Cucurbita moschata]